MLQRLDDWLIDRVAQPAADRLARWWTPQALGRSLLVGSAVFVTCRAFVLWRAGQADPATFTIGGLWAASLCWVAQSNPEDRRQRGMMPAARARWCFLRCFSLAIDPLFTGLDLLRFAVGFGEAKDALAIMERALCLAGLYLMACRNNPPPPRRAEAPARDMALAGAS